MMRDTWLQLGGSPWEQAEVEDLFLAHYGGLCRHLFRLVGSEQEAEDLAQETFIRLARQRFPADRRNHVRAWLYRVATHLAYNALRGRRRQERRQEMVARGALDGEAGDPAAEALRREERAAVRRALERLPARQSRLLLLHYAGLSYRELAEALRVAPGSVGTLLARARAAFVAAYHPPTAIGGGNDEHTP